MPDELAKIMARFSVWMDGMRANRAVVGTNGLQYVGKILRGPPGETTITDGPFAEGKEVIGGYVLVRARSLAAAVALAKKCPGLDYRMSVEVRPIQPKPRRGPRSRAARISS